MKKIIVYADGTWNTPANEEEGKVAPTNVYKLFESTLDNYTDKNGKKVEQLKYYTEGVGTSPGSDKYLGGLLGWGINENVIEVYRFIVDHYEPGDEIFLFGFSRGAYTVRSVAGLIRNCGILKYQYHQKIERAFEIYRSRKPKDKPDSPQPKFFKNSFCHPEGESAIKFLGVWDTVGSLGVPFRLLSFGKRHRFHDVELGRHIANAYHAVSIDDRRVFFRPSLWVKDKKHTHQKLEQVWFNGCHSDVGGGYPDYYASVLPMLYLQCRAEHHGLAFKNKPTAEECEKSVFATTHDPKTAKIYYRVLPDYFRSIDNNRNFKLNILQKAGLFFLKLIIKDTYAKGKTKKDFESCEYLHESVPLRYAKNKNELPENLHNVFDHLVKQNRVIGLRACQ
jgi:uncharacterized protein (DUF2235 family)